MFDPVARACSSRLLSSALRLTGNRSDAEDLVQETLLRGHRAWGLFDKSRDPLPWLLLIVKRCFLDERRKRNHRQTETGTDAGSSEAWAEYMDAQRILAYLRPDYREVLELSMSGHGHREIATELGIPRGTSHSRLHRARKEFREIFEGS